MSTPAARPVTRRSAAGAAAPGPQGQGPSEPRATPRRTPRRAAGGGDVEERPPSPSPPPPPSEPREEARPRLRKRRRPREVLTAPVETPERTKRLYDFLLSDTMDSVLRAREPTAQQGDDDTQARAPRCARCVCASHSAPPPRRRGTWTASACCAT
jgi:hypothetical protein